MIAPRPPSPRSAVESELGGCEKGLREALATLQVCPSVLLEIHIIFCLSYWHDAAHDSRMFFSAVISFEPGASSACESQAVAPGCALFLAQSEFVAGSIFISVFLPVFAFPLRRPARMRSRTRRSDLMSLSHHRRLCPSCRTRM